MKIINSLQGNKRDNLYNVDEPWIIINTDEGFIKNLEESVNRQSVRGGGGEAVKKLVKFSSQQLSATGALIVMAARRILTW